MLLAFLDSLPLGQTLLIVGLVAVMIISLVVSIVKGIIRTFFTLIGIAAALVAFGFGLTYSPPLIRNVIPEAIDWMPYMAGTICALVVLVVIQLILGIFLGGSSDEPEADDPIGPMSPMGPDGKKKKKKRFNPLAPIIGLLLGVAAIYGAITGIRYFGTEAELKHFQTYISEGAEKAGEIPLLARAKLLLDESPVAAWHEKFDFLNTPNYRSRLNLARLIIVSSNREELTKAWKLDGVKEALSIPEVKAVAISGDDLRDLCADQNFKALFENEQFNRLTSRPSTQRSLLKLKLEDIIPKKKKDEDEDEKPAAKQ